MRYLILTTIVWAFSFSLIGEFLAGTVNSYTSAFIRSALATLVFFAVFPKRFEFSQMTLQLTAIGAVQLGFMYLLYFQSFTLLSVPLVLLFTIMTPIYVTIIGDLFDCTFRPRLLFVAVMAVLGAFIIRQ